MRTRANLWIFVASAIFLLMGIITREARFLALIIPLLTFMTLASLFAPPTPSISVERALETETTYEGEDVAVIVTLRNTGDAIPFLEVYDSLPTDSMVTEGTNHLVLTLKKGETKTMDYKVKFKVKGHYVVGPLVLRSRDPFGMNLKETRVQAEAVLVVSPRIEDLRRVSILPRRTRPSLGHVRAKAAGLGTDFWTIREYQAGDELRRINWKASARLDSLLTNDKEAERSGDVILVLDAREEANVGYLRHNTIELGVKATVSLAARLLHDRNRVGLVIQREILDWVYPAFGQKQLYRIIDALVSVRPGGEWPFEQIAWVLNKYFPPKSLIIIISPLVDRTAMESVTELRARGFDIILLSPSFLEVERMMADGDRYTDIAYRVLKMRRDASVAYLRQFAHVVDWNPREALALALKEVSLWPRYGR
ncbi:MAG: DUF58 domain-containing protein [Candidatus Geothermarchaeales archaeon]